MALRGLPSTTPRCTKAPRLQGFPLVGAPRFELGTSSPPDWRANQAAPRPAPPIVAERETAPVRRRPPRPRPGDLELVRAQVVPVPPGEAFAFFADPRNLEAITPPWLRFRILEAPAELRRGSLLRYRLRLWGVPVRWRTEITDWQPPRTFTDTQLHGPYRLWVHSHRFVPVDGGTEIFDSVRYRVPGGHLAERLLVGRSLDEIFAYRAKRMAELLGPPPT
jgi:ligand-binding SRPBCC domain-containing protein